MKHYYSKFLLIIIVWQLFFSHTIVYGQSKNDQKVASKFNIRELALPTDVKSIGKTSGSIYYSPAIKNGILMPVHIWGEIRRTGLHFVPTDTTLVKGLSYAGGPGGNARLSNVKLKRKDKSGLIREEVFDLSEGGDDEAHTYKLQPGDTIFVERSHFYENRAYVTGLIGVIATVLSTILLYREVKK